jgi:hypothetical protein
MVDNAGNTQASCRMHLIDPTGRLDGDFDPPAVGIEPGGSSLVRLKLRSVRRQWERRSRAVPFKVEADQQGAPTAEATASFIQAPMLPERLWSRVFGLLVVAALAGGLWFGVIDPAIDDAAEDAVAGIEPVTVVPTTVSDDVVDAPSTTTVVVEQPAEVDDGDPITVPLPAGTPYTVPAGQALLIDQAIVRNPYGDEGTATLNLGNVAFPFDLVDLQQGLDWAPDFTTPIRLESGEQAIFDVTCTANGQPGAVECATQAVVVGRLVDA